MEQGLQNCCGPIRIGKILIQSDAVTHEAKVLYSNFPPEFSSRKVLLMYPIMSEYLVIVSLHLFLCVCCCLADSCIQKDGLEIENLMCGSIPIYPLL